MVSYRDWVVETSSTTGTGAYALSGSAPAGTSYFTFRQRYANGENEIVYWVVNADRTKWEKSRFGTLTYGSPDTLSRNVVESTNGDAPVSWVGGDTPLRIYVVPDADAEEFAITMGLGAAAPGVLKFGLWADEDDVAPGIHTIKFRDISGPYEFLIASVNPAAGKYIPAPTAINFPPGHIQGLTYGNNSGDATNDIDIFAGSCADSTGVYPMVLVATLTKRLDAAWAVGNANGGLDTGSIADADYFIHLIARSDTGVVDALFSLSLSSPTMPANFDYNRPVGWIQRTSGAIRPFTTYERGGGAVYMKWTTPTMDISLLNTLTTSRNVNSLSVLRGQKVEAHIRFYIADAAANALIDIVPVDEVDAAPAANASPLANVLLNTVTATEATGELRLMTGTNGQIAARATLATVDVYRVASVGFEWSRR